MPPNDDLSSLKDVLLDVARQRGQDKVLRSLVHGIAQDRPHVQRACVWLLKRPSPSPEEPNELILAASARKSTRRRREWTHDAGDFSRVPLDEPLIGQVARDRTPRFAGTYEPWPDGLPDWAEREKLVAYVAFPLELRGVTYGVFGLFADRVVRSRIKEGRDWMEIFVEHASAAVANAHAFEEIDRLRERLQEENSILREAQDEFDDRRDIVGRSKSLQKSLQQAEIVAPTDATVLITGESGTGKELFARAIHQKSHRSTQPLVTVNCASIPESLFESEFFGHVKGAFTGASQDRRGRFELAHGGTIFLDEVAEIPLELQAKLLRVLQESTFERLGDEMTRSLDVRVIAATNRDLQKEIERERFREDLFYRISVFPIEIPPLRQRKEDIPVLSAHFLGEYRRRLGARPVHLTQAQIERLKQYEWPGNVRELQNVIQRLVITARSGSPSLDLPSSSKQATNMPPREAPSHILSEREMKQFERENLKRALKACDGRVFGEGGAAALLGISPTTLNSRLKSAGIK